MCDVRRRVEDEPLPLKRVGDLSDEDLDRKLGIDAKAPAAIISSKAVKRLSESETAYRR